MTGKLSLAEGEEDQMLKYWLGSISWIPVVSGQSAERREVKPAMVWDTYLARWRVLKGRLNAVMGEVWVVVKDLPRGGEKQILQQCEESCGEFLVLQRTSSPQPCYELATYPGCTPPHSDCSSCFLTGSSWLLKVQSARLVMLLGGKPLYLICSNTTDIERHNVPLQIWECFHTCKSITMSLFC